MQLPFAKGVTAINNPRLQQSEVPSGWMLAKLRELADINPKGFPRLADDKEVSFIPMAMVEEETGRVDSSATKRYREVRKGYTPFTNGDIIFAKITPCMENGKIAIVYSLKNGVGFGSTEFHVIRPKSAVSREFLFYYLMNKEFRKNAQRRMRGTAGQQRVPSKFLSQTLLPLPPLPEQQKIALIFSKVDDLIQKTEEIIERTQRLKKALMQHLLTKGVGHTEYKQTKMGTLPAKWNIVLLKDIAAVRYGLSQPPETDNDGIPMVRATNIKMGEILSDSEILKVKPPNRSAKDVYLRSGDIIVVRSGVYTGDIGFVTPKFEGALAGYDLVVSVSRSIHPRFLAYHLLSPGVQNYFSQLKARTAQAHLNSEQLSNTRVVVPPYDEQEKIVNIMSLIEDKRKLTQQNKGLLENLKKGLMQKLLTGKIRVKV